MRLRAREIVIGCLGLGILLIGYLIFSGMRGQQQYYLHLDEIERMAAEIDGKGVRINGRVEPGSIRKAPQRLVYDFAITDGQRRVTVHYEGVVSDMFKDGVEVVVEGRYDARRNHVEATRLLTKCPSKYQADAARP